MQKTPLPPTRQAAGPAFLIVTRGDFTQSFYTLVPGQVTTIGRAATNRIIVRDEVCSRTHCEVFFKDGSWAVRDLASRNGTLVDRTKISGDWTLSSGDVIKIGECELAFATEAPAYGEDLASNLEVLDRASESIVLRTRETRYGQRSMSMASPVAVRDRSSQQIASLYRLALEMGTCPTPEALSRVVLDGLFAGVGADIGAVLLSADGANASSADSLEIAAFRTHDELPYRRVSEFLSQTVLAQHDAVLATVQDDDELSDRDSLGRMRAQSVICAPVRNEKRTLGLVHLYATDPDQPFDRDDLEYTLAVADQFGAGLMRLRNAESLAVKLKQKDAENRALREQLEIESELIGDSPEMRSLRDEIARLAPTDAAAMIRGESGVGKELVSRAIHANSPRRGGPFVTMNCAALSESLLESELFGHQKGAFTGATDLKIGKFEQADGGSIFLDEVGEMSLAIQAKFLRVLEGQPFERVGGNTPISVDVRVIAATNRNLEQAVREGQFRRDLYFRLHVVEINVPSLRDHIADVPELAEHFLRRFSQRSKPTVKRFSPRTLQALMSYDWPGNIRELRNVVERAAILCRGDTVNESDIRLSNLRSPERGRDEDAPASSPYPAGLRQPITLEELERRHILGVLEQTEWNKSQAAQILGIERSTLDRKLKRYRVNRPR